MKEGGRNRLESWGQSLLLKIPRLSEIRLGQNRVMAFLRAWHYVSRARIEGDYLEFGVMEGMSFKLSLGAAAKFISPTDPAAPRFFAFDSFQGLPDPDDLRDGMVWERGQCASSRETFEKNIRRAARRWQVDVVEGFYDNSLTRSLMDELGLKKAAFVVIDCDLYESTLQALRWITPIVQTGTVMYFDDWYYSHGDMTLGEPGACAKWLAENPHLSLTAYGDIGIMGKCFLVQRSDAGATESRPSRALGAERPRR